MGYLKAQLQQKELRINEVNDNFANVHLILKILILIMKIEKKK